MTQVIRTLHCEIGSGSSPELRSPPRVGSCLRRPACQSASRT